jgi:transmembrane 9 superfamily protein 2/4
MMAKNLLVIIVLLLDTISGFYLPGVAPVEFQKGDPVILKVNKLTSVHTQLPYAFYSMPFCAPEQLISKVENLGEILLGDRIMNSAYIVWTFINQMLKTFFGIDHR